MGGREGGTPIVGFDIRASYRVNYIKYFVFNIIRSCLMFVNQRICVSLIIIAIPLSDFFSPSNINLILILYLYNFRRVLTV